MIPLICLFSNFKYLHIVHGIIFERRCPCTFDIKEQPWQQHDFYTRDVAPHADERLPTQPSQPSQQPHEAGMMYCPVVTLRYKLQEAAQLLSGLLFFLHQKQPLPKLGMDDLQVKQLLSANQINGLSVQMQQC